MSTSNVSIVGAGINGLLTAFLITEHHPNRVIRIYDSDLNPSSENAMGVTLGSKDARHISGSESISFQSSVEQDALRKGSENKSTGWRLKSEDNLTESEIKWRSEFEASYVDNGGLNVLDYAHAQTNYSGLIQWLELANKFELIKKYLITTDSIHVYLEDKESFLEDLEMETNFCDRYYKPNQIHSEPNNEFSNLFNKKLIVPGLSIRVKSLALGLIEHLSSNKNVEFFWDRHISSLKEFYEDNIIWTSGVTNKQPDSYRNLLVQGLIGCWITVENPGFKGPFKIATPVPSAYINITPIGEELIISGGFGWIGEYTDPKDHKVLAVPVVTHFLNQVKKYLKIKVDPNSVDYCVRPSTPTGQPLCEIEETKSNKHIFISGSAKSGTTHAPVLANFALDNLR